MECTKVNCQMQAGTPTDNCGENCPWRTTAKTGGLISRAAALEAINAVKGVDWSQSGKVLCGKMYSQIKDLPAVDAIPVEWLRQFQDKMPNTAAVMGVDVVLKMWEKEAR